VVLAAASYFTVFGAAVVFSSFAARQAALARWEEEEEGRMVVIGTRAFHASSYVADASVLMSSLCWQER
jgi:hypothetical protein